MNPTHDVTESLVLLVVHTMVSIGAYRFLTDRKETTMPPAGTAAPVEATTPEQQARGERSFQSFATRRVVTVSTSWPVELYVVFGYAALAVSLILSLAGWLRTASR